MNSKTTETPRQTLDLPERPEIFYREPVVHTIFEDGHSTGEYTMTDPNGQLMPFGYRFDTRKGGITGFTVPGVPGAMTWAQLRKHYAPSSTELTERARRCAASLEPARPATAQLMRQLADENDRLRAAVQLTEADPIIRHLPSDDTEGGAA